MVLRMLRLRSLRSRFLADSMGTTALAFALAMPAVLGALGVAVDMGMLQAKRTQLQQAADGAAIAAAKELTVSTSDAKTIAATADVFARSSMTLQSSTLQVSANIGSKKDSVTVELREDWTPFFAHFLQTGVTPVVVQATAKLAGEANICVLTLNPTDGKSLHMDNSGRLEGNGCAVYSNSKSSEGIRLDAGSDLRADLVCSAGGVMRKSGAIPGKITEDCPPISDPLGDRIEPKMTGCDFDDVDISTGTVTLSPGTYCDGLKIKGNAQVTFETGDYIITGGKFEVEGSASVKGENVAFYLHGPKTTLEFKENTTLELTGAKSGPMAGLLFFEDRSAPAERNHRINSKNAKELTGTIYLSRGELRIDPNSAVAGSSDYTAIIVNKLKVYEGSRLVLNSDYGSSNVPVPEGIKLSDQVVLAN